MIKFLGPTLDLTLIALVIAICTLVWLAIKIITMLERQNQHHQVMQEIKNNLEHKLQNLNEMVNGNNNKNHDLQQKITEKLSKIDAAQTNIEKLSGYVIDLQAILTDKKSRGAFGEAQLQTLVDNIMPQKYAKMQYTLSNQKRADCLIVLPPPTNPIVIDAKFPLENFKLMANKNPSEEEYLHYKRLFKKDIKTHIDQIAEKYIIPPETSDSAIMFIPAEAIFSEIHSLNPDIVDYANQKRVWLASPTTLMAILTTASSVIKDNITQKNLNQVRKQLILLGQDFDRFDARIQGLFKHLEICTQDASKVQISAQKISNRFNQIQELEVETS